MLFPVLSLGLNLVRRPSWHIDLRLLPEACFHSFFLKKDKFVIIVIKLLLHQNVVSQFLLHSATFKFSSDLLELSMPFLFIFFPSLAFFLAVRWQWRRDVFCPESRSVLHGVQKYVGKLRWGRGGSLSFTWPTLRAAQWSPGWAAGSCPHTEPPSWAGCCSAH